ncbi:MAG: DedA family protein [Endomicrobium sp.]|jgi:membrane protein YqaA with SNARE-associated domain|uniref:YqaA family protein n=1 Tax=Candidatus Endomicrobiellum cubanum TaxID=3242325 RepID=UPI0028307FB5|nr:DedA family protein [Endomicrobium sp.]
MKVGSLSFFKFIRSMYDWTLHWAKSKNSSYALFFIAFIESSFFPVPPDVLLIPLVIAEPQKWWRKALICTIGSVLGAFLGYFIGKTIYDTVGSFLINFYNIENAVNIVKIKYAQNAFLSIWAGAFTPIPYKAITITAGMFDISLYTLFFASVLGRGGRFFIIAFALKFFGKKVQNTIEKYFNILSLIFLLLLILCFLAFKYL